MNQVLLTCLGYTYYDGGVSVYILLNIKNKTEGLSAQDKPMKNRVNFLT